MFQGYKTLSSFFSFTGELTHYVIAAFLKPLNIRLKATLYHIEQSGAGALPIILLTSFLIGIVIAYQGATQLEKFGANIFIVEMVTISAVRELAPLLTAIVVAGRSSSAYTAQIGVMKITDEVDAMSAMGFSPWNFLVLPRLFALILSLPLLVFFADDLALLLRVGDALQRLQKALLTVDPHKIHIKQGSKGLFYKIALVLAH
jgi:phospholipid/cholesterol/gamma-HCH transport system permease protein